MSAAASANNSAGADESGHPFSLSGRVALVTGSSRGIGRAIALALARAGARVILHGRDPAALEAAVGDLRARGHEASGVCADVADEEAMVDALKRVVDRNRRLDILVNNAGISSRTALADMPTGEWRRVIDCDLTSCFFVAREAGRAMSAGGWGRIINIASVAGLIAAHGRAGYVAAKHGLIGLTRSLALELGGSGVTANAIAPGFVATEMNADMRRDAALDQWVRGRNPLQRWGRPEDVAGAAVYLASPAAEFVNGAVLVVDGGMSAVA